MINKQNKNTYFINGFGGFAQKSNQIHHFSNQIQIQIHAHFKRPNPNPNPNPQRKKVDLNPDLTKSGFDL